MHLHTGHLIHLTVLTHWEAAPPWFMHRCNLTLIEHRSGIQLCSASQLKRNPTSNCCINSRHCSSACPSRCLCLIIHPRVCTQTLTVCTFWGTCSLPGNLQNPSLGSRSPPAFPHAQQRMRADAETCRATAQHLLTCPDLFLCESPWSHPKGRTESLQGSGEENQDSHQSMLCTNNGIWKKPWTARRLPAATQFRVLTLGCRGA